MNLRCGLILATMMLAGLTSSTTGQSSTDGSSQPTSTKNVVSGVQAPSTKPAPAETTTDAVPPSSAVKEIDLLDDDLHLMRVDDARTCGSVGGDGPACGADRWGRNCCPKGEVCVKAGACCAVGYKFCQPDPKAMDWYCIKQSEACTTKHPPTTK
jgi:hypothetical protein